MASHARQLIFGRTCCTTLKDDGTYSSTSVTSSPIRRSTVPPQHEQASCGGCVTCSRGRCAGNGLRPVGLLRFCLALLAYLLVIGLAIGLFGARLAFRSTFLEVADQEFELFDLTIELLGGAAEARAPQHRKLRLEMLDLQCLGVKLGVAHRDQAVALGELRFLLGNDPLAFA